VLAVCVMRLAIKCITDLIMNKRMMLMHVKIGLNIILLLFVVWSASGEKEATR
jgi:hypothetical protein